MKKTTRTTKVVKTTKTAKVAKAQPKADALSEAQWRVIGMPKPLLASFRQVRDAREATNQQLLTQAVGAELPVLVEMLTSLGVEHADQGGKARWLIDDVVLNALRAASQKTGLDMSALMLTCIRRHCGSRTEAKAPRGCKAKGGAR